MASLQCGRNLRFWRRLRTGAGTWRWAVVSILLCACMWWWRTSPHAVPLESNREISRSAHVHHRDVDASEWAFMWLRGNDNHITGTALCTSCALPHCRFARTQQSCIDPCVHQLLFSHDRLSLSRPRPRSYERSFLRATLPLPR